MSKVTAMFCAHATKQTRCRSLSCVLSSCLPLDLWRLTVFVAVLASYQISTALPEAAAEDAAGPRTALTLAPGPNNPRNSEGDFIRLDDGRLMFVYTRFSGGEGDHDSASLVARFSEDQGRTWSADDVEIVKNEGNWNVMSVSLLRLQSGDIGLFYLRKNSLVDCRPVLRISTDEGRTWGEPTLCITDEVGYYVLNNDRVVQLKSGRLVVPVALHHRPGAPKPRVLNGHLVGEIMCYVSDDVGKTWRRSVSVLSAIDNQGNQLITQEPGVVELTDGRLLMFVRSNAGSQLLSFSEDGGLNWSELKPSNIISPVSPASIERIPQTGDLLLVWNNHDQVDNRYKGKRTPFHVAVSRDDGKTWSNVKTLADDPEGWYCYTAITFLGDDVLLGHCAGDRRTGGLNTSKITRFSLDWLYR